jgi:hypothetical protein
MVKRKILSPYRDSNPPIIQPVAQHYTTELTRLVFTAWCLIKHKELYVTY